MAEFKSDDVKEIIKTGAGKAKEGAEKLTQTIIGKTETLVGKAKIKYSVSETEKKLDDVYMSVGKYVYEKYATMATEESEISDKFSLIESLKAEIDRLNEKLKEFDD